MDGSLDLRRKLRDSDPYVRRDACEAIAESRSPEYIGDLIRALYDKDPSVKEAALNALTAIGGGPVAEAVVPLIRTDDAALRNTAVEILSGIGTDAMGTISSLLNDPDDDVVKFGIDIIAGISDERTTGALKRLTRHRNPNVRASAALCLGKLRAGGSAQCLLGLLDEEKEDWVKFSIIEGLGFLEDRKALGPLLDVVEKGSSILKESSLEALARISGPEDAPGILVKLEGLLKRGLTVPVGAVVELIEKASLPGSDFRPGPTLRAEYSRFLSNAVDESEGEAKVEALKGLSLLRSPAAIRKAFDYANGLKEIDEETEAFLVDIVVKVSSNGPLDEILREELSRPGKNFKVAVKSVREMRCLEALELLEDSISKVNSHDLREVVSAIEAIGSRESLPVLYKCLRHSDGHTRKTAAGALARLAGPEAVGSLLDALSTEPYRDVMEGITDALAAVQSDEVKEGFLKLLSSGNPALREMSARGLGLMGDMDSILLLAEAAKDPNPGVRKAAYNSMARLGTPGALEEVVKGLKDADDNVKLSVLKALGGWAGEGIKGALLEALRDRNIWVRYHAVLLLGETGAPDCEGPVTEMLLKDEAPVKAAAAKALERLGATGALKALELFINHPDPSVRAAVENAIGALRC